MNLMLLAAGEGVRFRPQTERLPKPAIPFCGVPLIKYSLYFSQPLKITNLIINTYHLSQEIHKLGESLNQPGMTVTFSDEQPTLLGGGGGIAKAQPILENQEDFIAMNADEVIIPKKNEIIRDFYFYSKSSTDLSTLLVTKHPEAGKTLSAVWVNAKGEVKGFGKTPPEGQGDDLIPYHFIGPMYFKRKIFSYLKIEPSNILHDNLMEAIKEGERVAVYHIECDWYETGNLKDYLEATKNFLPILHSDHSFLNDWKERYLKEWSFVKTAKGIIFKHKTAQIESEKNIEGFAVLGPHCNVTSNVFLKNVVCAENINLSKESRYQNELFL